MSERVTEFYPHPAFLLPILWLIFSCLPLDGGCDGLSELPAYWQGRLQPLAEADLSGAEPYARKVIGQQREAVGRLLADPATETPELGQAYGRLGALYQVFHLAAAARTCYQNAMALAPENFRWTYYAGYLAAQNGRHDEAVGLYQRARQLRPDYAPLGLRLGESRLELNRLEAASQALQEAAESPGLRAMALYLLAQIDLLERRYEPAIEKLETVLELDPQADQARYPLARALRAQGENERARRQLALQGKRLPEADDPLIRELETLDQGARRFFAEGLQAGRRQDFAAAARAFAEGLEIEPDNVDARVSYARALLLSGEKDAARHQLENVLERAPEHALALFLSAILLEDDGRIAEALTRYREVLQLEPDHYGAHYCLANRLYRQGDFQAAADHYAAALANQPDIPPARLYELLARRQAGLDDTQILSRLDALVEAHPQQQILRYVLIRLLVLSPDGRVRDLERARQLVNRLVQEAFIPAHVQLQALVAAALGHYEQAVSLQQQALPALTWMGMANDREAEAALQAYERGELPEQVWYRDAGVLLAPEADVTLLFREFPSAVPY